MHNFDFVKPSTIAEATAALAAEGAQAISGGQTLTPTLKQRLAQPAVLVSLTGIAEMKGVCLGDGGLSVGAATPHAVVAKEAAKYYPALAALAGGIGDPAVRNRGTIGGSIANNDPAADYPAAVLASGATVVTNARKIAADDFFQGLFTTALEAEAQRYVSVYQVLATMGLLTVDHLQLGIALQAAARIAFADDGEGGGRDDIVIVIVKLEAELAGFVRG